MPIKCYDLLEKISLDPVTQACVDKKCTSCPSLDMEVINDSEKIAYYAWEKGDRYYEKVLCENTGEEVYSMVKQQIDNIHEHYYRKCVQDDTYQKQIVELCEGEVVIHVDYSKNFKNKQQNEIPAEYLTKVNLVYSQ